MKHSIHLSGILSIYLFLITIVTAQSSKIDSSYFPLKIGNQWSYSEPHSIHKASQEIIDTASINGHFCYLMNVNSVDRFNFKFSFKEWFRISNDTIFAKREPGAFRDSIEYPVYNFKANVGDTLHASSFWFGSEIILISKEDTVSTLSGTYTHCYHFKHKKGLLNGGLIDSWLAPVIGTIKLIVSDYPSVMTFELDSSSLITSINNETKTNFDVSAYLLFESYPNPFNPQTTLTYQINSNGNVLLEIFDVLGRKVDQLVNKRKESGRYNVIWNGEKMPSGLYFAILRSNNNFLTRKLILQK